jgi:apolipoprotein N-acyltransferase
LLRTSARGTGMTPRQSTRLWIVTIMLGGSLVYGAVRLSTAQFREGPRLALLQTNFEQRYKMGGDPLEILERISHLVQRAAAAQPPPDLIVWPETAYPYPFISIDQATSSEVLSKQVGHLPYPRTIPDWLDQKEKVAEHLHSMADALRIPMLVGILYYDHRPESLSKYNSALLLEPTARLIRAYHKIHLVPFGEFIPFLETLPWLKIFTPYRDGYVPTLTFGRDAVTIPLGPYRMAIAICFEDTVPHVIRRFFKETPDGRQPDMLVNMSNDGWFHGSSELDMHLAVSVFRTIEHRVPLVRAVNTGISALIDGNGEIRDTLPRLTESVLSISIPLDDRSSLYTLWGDWLGLSCLAVTIGLVPMGFFRERLARIAR